LQETEDALDRAAHESLDLVLRGRWRWVEHLALAVAVRRVHSVQKDGVQMQIEPQVTVGALDDCNSPGLARGKAAVGVATPVPPGNTVREDAHHLAQQLPVEGERETQRERHRDHELSQRHVGQNVIHRACWARCTRTVQRHRCRGLLPESIERFLRHVKTGYTRVIAATAFCFCFAGCEHATYPFSCAQSQLGSSLCFCPAAVARGST
jgi:hypothetical protein